MIVLDASALLAFLFREPGGERVRPHLPQSCLSAVNLAEVLARFVRDGHDGRAVYERLTATHLELVPYTAEQAQRTAALVPTTRPLGLSLADRACLALAIERGLPALTADRAWLGLDLGVRIECIR